MSPQINFSGNRSVRIGGSVGVKREYGKTENDVYLCMILGQSAKDELEALKGDQIFGLTGDENGIVYERGSGRKFSSGETLIPLPGERFYLRGIEKSNGIEG